MQKKLKLAVIALCCPAFAFAQTPDTEAQKAASTDESAFTFTEAQLGEDDNVSQEVTVINSNNNVYARDAGFRFSAARFKYRAYDSKYSDIYINGVPVNDIERGQFRYSFVGGLNNFTRGLESGLPFESTHFAMPSLGSTNNYNFRPSAQAAGHRLSLAGANRSYTLRGMYAYNSGLSSKGWAFSAGLTYRWASMETSYVEGTFYNALSYFLGIEKVFGDHSISLVTWGNPTERGGQGASTDEMFWIANDRYYNPYWGYQDGKKRNSRVVHDFAPAALLTWDWKIDDKTNLTTSLLGKYSMYSSSKLERRGGDNPQPDYYSKMPSYYYDVWAPYTGDRSEGARKQWQETYDFLSSSKANRQLNWNQLYYSNKLMNEEGQDGKYYQQAYHDDQFTMTLASTLKKALTNKSTIDLGINASHVVGMHYQTMEDLLGANSFHNVNDYAISTYGENADEVQYDLRNRNGIVRNGDKFAYDYNTYLNKGNVWALYSEDFGPLHYFVSGRIGGTTIQRDGKMQNGLAPDNSYGKSHTAKFLDGGAKFGSTLNLGAGNTFTLGLGYEEKAPTARVAFISPQVNNDFVNNLKNENIFSAEVGYHLQTSWLAASLNGYYSRMTDVTEYSMYYNDADHSFTYVSLTGIKKHYFGLELGLNFKITEELDIKALGTISDAKYINNSNATYMRSDAQKSDNGSYYYQDVVRNKGIHEGSTPLTATSIDLSFHKSGWFIDLIGNYYDRIYLYYSPMQRYQSLYEVSNAGGEVGGNGTQYTEINGKYYDFSQVPSQAKGHGGFMLDLNIGKSMYLPKGRSMSINLMLSNLLNNRSICTGGMEQNRLSGPSMVEDDTKTYDFINNPKKYYAFGLNGMLNVTYKF